jgi:hypothetical protein
MTATVPRLRHAAAWLPAGPLLPAALAAALALVGLALAPAPARANDRGPRGTPVSASACVQYQRAPGTTVDPWINTGYSAVGGVGYYARLRCPLPLNHVDLSGTTNDNDLSKLRIHYHDTDGPGPGSDVYLVLARTTTTGGVTAGTDVCRWDSNVDGTGATTPAKATKACAHDLAEGASYHFGVTMRGGGGFVAQFIGVDFPP